jgi:hypothetical protein
MSNTATITRTTTRPTFRAFSYYSEATNEKLRAAHEAGCDHCEKDMEGDYRTLPHYIIGRLAMMIELNAK